MQGGYKRHKGKREKENLTLDVTSLPDSRARHTSHETGKLKKESSAIVQKNNHHVKRKQYKEYLLKMLPVWNM